MSLFLQIMTATYLQQTDNGTLSHI
jgi:hypothetical protein